MKMSLLLLLFVALPLLCFAGSERPRSAPAGLTSGSIAPDFSLETMQGEKVSLSQLRGKLVIVNFWATWCPPCRAEMPSMELLHQTFKDDGLVLLAINVEEEGAKAVAEFLQQTPYSFPVLLDEQSQAQSLYGVYRYPESFIIDRSGVVVKRVTGALDWMAGDTYNLLHFLLKG